MTLTEAIDTARAIQADLDAGRLRVPYPEVTRKTIMQVCGVFMDYATDTEAARALVARLNAPVEEVSLPW